MMEPAEFNCVQNLLKNPLSFEEKLLIKRIGRPIPDLQINYTSTSKSRTYNRVFNKNIYEKYEWMCGCSITNKLFCFMCLIFKKEVSAWNKQGLNDLKHIAERAKKHENSVSHMNACMDFSVLGKVNIREQLNSAYLRQKIKYNEDVEKNRHILRRLIMCIKFCGAFELALRGHDEPSTSENPGLYIGLINFAAELDGVLAPHMKGSHVFKGVSKTVQNELLDAMLEIYKQEILKEIKSANFISLEVDETTDTSNHQQMVVIIRYVFNGQICERFWSFFKRGGHKADVLAKTLLNELQTILNSPSAPDNNKLIAQSYDGASVMSAKTNGVQAIIKRTYPHAHFIHCYAHEFNLIIERAAHCNKKIKIFFAHLQSFSSFFSLAPKRTVFLDDIVKCRSPRAAPTCWNFKSRTANTLFEHQDSFKECLDKIIDEDGMDSITISEASGLLKHLNCPEFLYWLKIFHFIMPHVEILFNQTQMRGIESAQMQKAVEQFQQQIIRIRNSTDNVSQERDNEEPARKIQKTSAGDNSRAVIAKEVCDTILSQIIDRFSFKDHLSAANLFDSQNFKTYRHAFPQKHFDETVKSYPMLDSVKLKSELSAIYARDDMCDVGGILPLLVFISDNNLKKVLTETYKLLDIICTTPMSTAECERCFSTLKRIKTFLRSTMSEDRLNALAVLSIEKKFVQSIPDFDNKVIDVFFGMKNRRMDFMYKKYVVAPNPNHDAMQNNIMEIPDQLTKTFGFPVVRSPCDLQNAANNTNESSISQIEDDDNIEMVSDASDPKDVMSSVIISRVETIVDDQDYCKSSAKAISPMSPTSFVEQGTKMETAMDVDNREYHNGSLTSYKVDAESDKETPTVATFPISSSSLVKQEADLETSIDLKCENYSVLSPKSERADEESYKENVIIAANLPV